MPDGAAAHSSQVLLALFLVFVGGQIGAEVAQRLRMPAVVGEIAAGIILGPGLLGWVRPGESLHVLAEIGAVFLLFAVGLETRLADLRRVGATAAAVAVAGVVLPFALGGAWALGAGYPWPRALFVAAAFVATSAGITARVLQELGALDRSESRVILGAAVIDDVLAMLILGVVMALQGGRTVNAGGLALLALQAVLFVGLIAWLGTRVMRRTSPLLDAPVNPHSPLSLTLGLCLGLAFAASSLGLAGIIGAFLAGIIAAESRQRDLLQRQMGSVNALVVPFFFVVTGATVELRELASWPAVATVLVVTALAILGKLVACGLAAARMGRRSALIVGWGMVPRGEVGIIVASLGRQAGVLSPSAYTVIIAMSLLTSVLAPPILKLLLAKEAPDAGKGAEAEPDESR